MNRTKLSATILGAIIALGATTIGADAKSDTSGGGGVAAVYGNISPDQVEFLSSSDHITSVAASGAPTAVWEALEHGEAVECLDCIGAVAPLLFDADPKNREISAWWLRRRMFGVFGPGEVYSSTVASLTSETDPLRRSYAANALGEFLVSSGITPLATALKSDSDAGVRAAAATALGRLNDGALDANGHSAFIGALADSDAGVRMAALTAAGRISSIGDPDFEAAVVKLEGDSSALVRKHAVMLLDEMNAKDALASVMQLAKGDSDEDTRIAACHALGTFADATALPTLQYIVKNDTSTLVQDMAAIAIRLL